MYEKLNHRIAEADNPAVIEQFITDGFDGKNPDVLFALTAPNKQNKVTGEYRSMAYGSLDDDDLAPGGRLRIFGAAAISNIFEDMPIVVNSYNQLDDQAPTLAAVAEKELIKRGVPSERIIKEEQSINTGTQLVEMIGMSLENGWNNVLVEVSDYHIPRVTEMFRQLDTLVDDEAFTKELQKFKSNGGTVSIVGAEQVLRLVNSRFDNYLNAILGSAAYKRAVASERRGLYDLKAGKYQLALTPEKPRISK